MRLQMLVSTVQQEGVTLIQKMNIEADTILVNQCGEDHDAEFMHGEYQVKEARRSERGVGKSRNLALSMSDADIVLFSDEDIRYREGYATDVLQAFEELEMADVILFNMNVCEARRTYYNNEVKRVHKYNCGRYPAYSIALRRDQLLQSGVKFSELFGGGAKYSNGEDSLFLHDCIKAGLRIYTSPVLLGQEEPRESTWFHGYTEKFFFDRGVLFAFLYGNSAGIWALRFVTVKKEYVSGKIGKKQALRLLKDGIAEGKRLKKEDGKVCS